MILPNMSYQEIAAHLSSDMDEALAFSKKIKFARYRSEAIKLKRYPLFFKPVGYTSSQHNKWFIFPHVRNRADLVSIPFSVGCTFTKYNRLCLFIQMDLEGENSSLKFIFTNRFFERYADRKGITGSLTQEEIVYSFIKELGQLGLRNMENKDPLHAILFYETGMALGHYDSVDRNLVVFHSYVSVLNGPNDLKKMHHDWLLFRSVFN